LDIRWLLAFTIFSSKLPSFWFSPPPPKHCWLVANLASCKPWRGARTGWCF